MTPRRDFLALAAGAVGAGTMLSTTVAAAEAHPDAELLAIGQEAAKQAAAFQAYLKVLYAARDANADEEVRDRIGDMGDAPFDALEEMAGRVIKIRAQTLEGAITKAHLLRHYMHLQHAVQLEVEFEEMDYDDRLAWSLANDLIAMGRA